MDPQEKILNHTKLAATVIGAIAVSVLLIEHLGPRVAAVRSPWGSMYSANNTCDSENDCLWIGNQYAKNAIQPARKTLALDPSNATAKQMLIYCLKGEDKAT